MSRIRTFWQKYRRYVFISLAVYVLLTLITLYFAAGAQKQPFIYQTF